LVHGLFPFKKCFCSQASFSSLTFFPFLFLLVLCKLVSGHYSCHGLFVRFFFQIGLWPFTILRKLFHAPFRVQEFFLFTHIFEFTDFFSWHFFLLGKLVHSLFLFGKIGSHFFYFLGHGILLLQLLIFQIINKFSFSMF
jgi:hypothetical protein